MRAPSVSKFNVLVETFMCSIIVLSLSHFVVGIDQFTRLLCIIFIRLHPRASTTYNTHLQGTRSQCFSAIFFLSLLSFSRALQLNWS